MNWHLLHNNKRRQSCEAVVAAIKKNHPTVEFLRDCTMDMLNEVKAEVSEEDYMRAEYVIERNPACTRRMRCIGKRRLRNSRTENV